MTLRCLLVHRIAQIPRELRLPMGLMPQKYFSTAQNTLLSTLCYFNDDNPTVNEPAELCDLGTPIIPLHLNQSGISIRHSPCVEVEAVLPEESGTKSVIPLTTSYLRFRSARGRSCGWVLCRRSLDLSPPRGRRCTLARGQRIPPLKAISGIMTFRRRPCQAYSIVFEVEKRDATKWECCRP